VPIWLRIIVALLIALGSLMVGLVVAAFVFAAALFESATEAQQTMGRNVGQGAARLAVRGIFPRMALRGFTDEPQRLKLQLLGDTTDQERKTRRAEAMRADHEP
jgi:hypothetical protein